MAHLFGWKAMPFALEDFDSNYKTRQTPISSAAHQD